MKSKKVLSMFCLLSLIGSVAVSGVVFATDNATRRPQSSGNNMSSVQSPERSAPISQRRVESEGGFVGNPDNSNRRSSSSDFQISPQGRPTSNVSSSSNASSAKKFDNLKVSGKNNDNSFTIPAKKSKNTDKTDKVRAVDTEKNADVDKNGSKVGLGPISDGKDDTTVKTTGSNLGVTGLLASTVAAAALPIAVFMLKRRRNKSSR